MFIGLLFILCLICSNAAPYFDTTNNQIDQQETSTISLDTTTNLSHNETDLTLNISNTTVLTTAVNNVSNSTDKVSINAKNGINGKVVYNTTYSYYSYTSASDSSSGLSGGAIAGIVIGIIVLLCCIGCIGGCKSGHWETHKVWVRD